MNNSVIPDYSSFHESFDDLCAKLANEDKYLATYLRESIPLEAWYWFFDILHSVLNHVFYHEYHEYPSSDESFHLTTEYLQDLFKDWKVKVKLKTPVPIFHAETWETIKYTSKDVTIYDNPDFIENLISDMQERYDALRVEGAEWGNPRLGKMQVFCDHYVIISYGDRPFWDEL